MYFCRRFLGFVLTGLFVAGLFASANGPKELNKYNKLQSQPTKVKVLVKTLPEVNQTYRSLADIGVQSDSRDCTDCEFDFTDYGSECCDSAWDDFGINCADLEANYNWDCSGCLCPGDGDPVCGDGSCNGDETYETCPEDCNAPGDCDAGYVIDCVDDDCCPESWIGDGFADCEDQQYGCDLTCYDNDGGDCDGGGTTTTTTTTSGTEACEACDFDWSPYGSECCDTAWDEFGIDCATLEGTYGWDCTGCSCPGDTPAVCGDGACTGDEDYYNCPEDCEMSDYPDCAGNISWIGDGWCDSSNNNADCGYDGGDCCPCTCYDNVDAGCPEAGGCYAGEGIYDYCGTCDACYDAVGVCPDECTAGECGDGDCGVGEDCTTCPADCGECPECDAGYVQDCVDADCCPESWVGDGFEDCEDQAYGCDLTCYDNDGGDCGGGTTTTTGSDTCSDCEFDFTPYGSECCDSAWSDFGINCADLEANYNWDCSGCNCPGDGGGTTTTTDGGECDPGYVEDCVDDDCCPESWIGDGFEDCEDQAYGCDLTCYDNDGGDCPEACPDFTCWDGSCVGNADDCPDEPVIEDPTGVCAEGASYAGYPAVTVSWDIDTVCGDGVCNGDEDYYNCPDDCNAPGECDAGYVEDCADDDCCPESWIGDGFADCEDQAYGCDLTCYDNDGGDCGGGTTTTTTTSGTEACDDCEFDFTAYGSECCDTAWDEYGLDCASLEANYNWDCSGCNCPGDGPAVCGDGACTGDETYESCPDDCLPPGECEAGYITDCVDDDCCPESWIGDGFADCEDQQYGCDLTCYDNDGGDCGGGTTTTGGSSACDDCEFDFTAYGSECCDTAWDEFGVSCADLEANYSWDCSGCLCPGDGGGFNSDDNVRSETRQLAKTLIATESREGAPYRPATVSINDIKLAPDSRELLYTVALSCDACLTGGPWAGEWYVEPTAFGYFTVYGFDDGSVVSATVQACDGGACSNVIGPVTVVAGDATSSDCAEGGGDPCDGQAAGDANNDGTLNVLDVVGIVNYILAGGEGLDECSAAAADYNGDGTVNVLDVVAIVNLILAGGGREADATDATMNTTENGVNISANGYIGGVQITLSHDADFSIELTDDAYIAEYKTDGNTTTLIVINPEDEVIFTSTGDFTVEEVLVTNSDEFINVTEVTLEFSLSNAYPNPFNPTTTIELSLAEASYASVKVFNLKGAVVGVLMDGMVDASTYTMTWDASNLSSGVYMIRAEANGQIATQKVMLVK